MVSQNGDLKLRSNFLNESPRLCPLDSRSVGKMRVVSLPTGERCPIPSLARRLVLSSAGTAASDKMDKLPQAAFIK